MNLEQAFKVLNDTIASVNTTRQGHQVLNQALQALLSAALEGEKLKQENTQAKKPAELKKA